MKPRNQAISLAILGLILTFQPQTGSASDTLLGAWTGRATCVGAPPVEFEMQIVRERSQLVAVESWNSGGATGSLTYSLRAAPSGAVTFVPRSAPDVPQSEWRELQFTMNPAGEGRMEGRYTRPGRCSKRSMQRMTANSAQLPSQAATLMGAWQGRLACGRATEGDDAFLNFSNAGGGRIAATITSFGPRHLESGPQAIALIGEWDERQSSFRFAPERQRLGPSLRLNGVRGTLTGSGLELTFEGSNCQVLRAKRPSSDRQRPTRVARPTDGTVFRGSSLRARCEALGSWPERLRREYPGVEFDRTTNAGPRIALAFGDDAFVPVFGAPFDKLSDGDKTIISRQLVQECRRDPLLAQELRDMLGLFRGLSPVPLTSFGRTSLTYIVETQREVRHELSRFTGQVEEIQQGRGRSVDANLSIIQRSRALVEANKSVLWPSEVREAEQKIAAAEAQLFDHAATNELAKLRSDPDVNARLRSLAEVSTGKAAWFTRSSATFRTRAKAEITREHDDLSRELIAPLERAMANAEKNLAESRRIDKEFASLRLIVPHLSDAVRKSLLDAMQSWLAEMLSMEVRPYLQRLEITAKGSQGLRAASEQRRAFEATFSPYRSFPIVSTALLAFEADRRTRLREGVANFAREVSESRDQGRASPTEIKTLANRYLTDPEDWRRPIALAYRLAAARLGSPIPD
jgi:hypothetical protein